MGIKSSFITNYCTHLKMDLTEENLLSLEFQKISQGQRQTYDTQNKQLYQHYKSKKLYKLEKFTCQRKDSHLFGKALQSLQMIKNDHICNVLFTSINTNFPNIISKSSEIKLFTQHSSFNLLDLIDRKNKQKKQLELSYASQQQIIPFTNIEIADFIHSLSGVAGEIYRMSLPVECINPKDFLLMQNNAGKIKYDIQFQQILNPNRNSNNSGYFFSEINELTKTNLTFSDLNQTLWQQKYEKNIIFAFGMLILHFLLLQPCDDCYNYKSMEFCRSQLENKLSHLSKVLQKRLQNRQKRKQKSKDSSSFYHSETYVERLQTMTLEQEEPFQLVLYQTLVQMLTEDKTQRISVSQLKFRSRKLTQKVRQQITFTTQQNTFVSKIHYARGAPALIKSISNNNESQSFQEIYIKKTISAQLGNTTASILGESKSRSMIKHLKSKRVSDKEKNFILEKSFILDKENVHENIFLTSSISAIKGSIRKLSGYKKIKLSQHSFMEGFFQNNKAHGLGKITRKNGEVIECIFDNNQMIEGIPVSNQTN